jgi:hypothetical protein
MVRNPGYLAPDQVKVARQFELGIRQDPQRAVTAYNALQESLGGLRINSDVVDLLCPAFRKGTLRYRWRHSVSLRSTAEWFSLYLVRETIVRSQVPLHVIALLGPPGSGKTTAVDRGIGCDKVLEWTFGNLAEARTIFSAILGAGHMLTVVGVFVDPFTALNRIVLRSMNDGRAKSIDSIVHSYAHSPDNLLTLYREFSTRVQWRFLVNNAETQVLSNESLEWLERYRYSSPAGLREDLHYHLQRFYLPAGLYAAMRPHPSRAGGPCE